MCVQFHPKLIWTVTEAPDLARELCDTVLAAKQGGVIDALTPPPWADSSLGNVAWFIALGSLLDILDEKSREVHLSWPLTPELELCRSEWSDLLSTNQRAKANAAEDYERNCEPLLAKIQSFPPDNPWDFEYDLENLDLCELFVIGADRFWPDLRLETAFERTTREIRRTFVSILIPRVIADRGWTLEDGTTFIPWTLKHLDDLSALWLPGSFWWRHLPELITPEILSQDGQ